MKSAITSAIVYCATEELRSIVEEELKKRGVSHILLPQTLDECKDHLLRLPKALLIVDWNLSKAYAVGALETAQAERTGHVRPMLILTAKLDLRVVCTAAEYGVFSVRSANPNSKQSISELIGQMIRSEAVLGEFREPLGRAISARDKGIFDLSMKILKKIHVKNPDNWLIKAEMAECLIAQDLLDEAADLLNGVAQLDPPYLRGLHLMGRILMKQRDFKAAVAVLERANLFNPYNAERLLLLGNGLLQIDRIKDAEEKFDEVLDTDGSNEDATIGKATCLLMEEHVNEALSLLSEITSRLELASLFNIAAVFSMRNHRFDVGMNLYNAGLKTMQGDTKILARLVYNKGIGYWRWSKHIEALRCFNESLQKDPAYVKAQEAKARLSAALNQNTEDSLENYDERLETAAA